MAVIVDSSGKTVLSLSRESIYAETLAGIWGAHIEVLIKVTTEMALECWH